MANGTVPRLVKPNRIAPLSSTTSSTANKSNHFGYQQGQQSYGPNTSFFTPLEINTNGGNIGHSSSTPTTANRSNNNPKTNLFIPKKSRKLANAASTHSRPKMSGYERARSSQGQPHPRLQGTQCLTPQDIRMITSTSTIPPVQKKTALASKHQTLLNTPSFSFSSAAAVLQPSYLLTDLPSDEEDFETTPAVEKRRFGDQIKISSFYKYRASGMSKAEAAAAVSSSRPQLIPSASASRKAPKINQFETTSDDDFEEPKATSIRPNNRHSTAKTLKKSRDSSRPSPLSISSKMQKIVPPITTTTAPSSEPVTAPTTLLSHFPTGKRLRDKCDDWEDSEENVFQTSPRKLQSIDSPARVDFRRKAMTPDFARLARRRFGETETTVTSLSSKPLQSLVGPMTSRRRNRSTTTHQSEPISSGSDAEGVLDRVLNQPTAGSSTIDAAFPKNNEKDHSRTLKENQAIKARREKAWGKDDEDIDSDDDELLRSTSKRPNTLQKSKNRSPTKERPKPEKVFELDFRKYKLPISGGGLLVSSEKELQKEFHLLSGSSLSCSSDSDVSKDLGSSNRIRGSSGSTYSKSGKEVTRQKGVSRLTSFKDIDSTWPSSESESDNCSPTSPRILPNLASRGNGLQDGVSGLDVSGRPILLSDDESQVQPKNRFSRESLCPYCNEVLPLTSSPRFQKALEKVYKSLGSKRIGTSDGQPIPILESPPPKSKPISPAKHMAPRSTLDSDDRSNQSGSHGPNRVKPRRPSQKLPQSTTIILDDHEAEEPQKVEPTKNLLFGGQVNSAMYSTDDSNHNSKDANGFKSRRSLPIDQAFEFCRMHIAESRTVPEGITKKYPLKIDFSTLEARIIKLMPDLVSIVEGQTESYFLTQIQTRYKQLGAFRARNPHALLATVQEVQPGYYGTKGASVMSTVLVKLFEDKKILTNERAHPLRPADYILRVLLPEAAVRLIQQDRMEMHTEGQREADVLEDGDLMVVLGNREQSVGGGMLREELCASQGICNRIDSDSDSDSETFDESCFKRGRPKLMAVGTTSISDGSEVEEKKGKHHSMKAGGTQQICVDDEAMILRTGVKKSIHVVTLNEARAIMLDSVEFGNYVHDADS